jgi:hypothetical protein
MKVSPGADLFLNIRLKPAASMNRLEEVLVITKKEDRAPSVAEAGRVRAVDILTQRLPSVPDKPVVEPAGGAAANTTTPAAGNASASSLANKGVVKPATPLETAPAPKKAPEQPAANQSQVKSGASGDQPH